MSSSYPPTFTSLLGACACTLMSVGATGMGEKMTNLKTSCGEEQAEKERWRVISVHKGGVVKEI